MGWVKLLPFAVMVVLLGGILAWFWLVLGRAKRRMRKLLAEGATHESRNEIGPAILQYKAAMAVALGIGDGNEAWGLNGILKMMARGGDDALARLEAIYRRQNRTIDFTPLRALVAECGRAAQDESLRDERGLPNAKAIAQEARVRKELVGLHAALPSA